MIIVSNISCWSASLIKVNFNFKSKVTLTPIKLTKHDDNCFVKLNYVKKHVLTTILFFKF